MEVAPCNQKTGSHAASLLVSLNLQRQRAQFCDCVVRQRQNPGQLYPVHRCVLAASSPVLASILSSAGALVELQAPCLSDSILGLVLDYIYTRALPYIQSQQQYSNLLTAACYLQMDELQDTLRTEVNPADNANASTGAENQPHKDINDGYSKTVKTFSEYPLLSDSCSEHSLEREDQFWDGIDTCRSSSKNGENYRSTKNASSVSTSCSVPESTVNRGNCREVTYLTPKDLIRSIPCAAEVHRVSRVDREVQKDQFHSDGTVKPESWQMGKEEDLLRAAENGRGLFLLSTAAVGQEEEASTAEKKQRLCFTVTSKAEEKQTNRGKEEDKINPPPLLHLLTSHLKDNVSPSQCSSSPTSSLQHPCCEAVPVIRHSSTAAMAEVSTVPQYHPVSQASVSSSRAPDSRPGNTDDDRTAEGLTTKHKNHNGAHNQDYRNTKDHIGIQSWNYKDCSDQSAIQDLCYKSSGDESGILKQDYNSGNTDHDEHAGNEDSHMTGDTDHHAYSDSFQNHAKHLRDDSMPSNKDCSSFTRGVKYKTGINSEDFPTKHQQLDCSDCHNVSMATAAEGQSIHSQDLTTVVSPPVHDSDIGSDAHYEDLCLEEEAKEEQSYSSRCPSEMDQQDSYCNPDGPQMIVTSTKNAASSQHHDDNDTALDNVTAHTSLEHENISGTEVSESHLTFTMPMDNNMSDPTYNVLGQSYRGHLHYHCLPKEDSHIDSDHKHCHPDHSDQSSDEEELGTCAGPGLSPLRQHFVTTDQVLLLDISTKPAKFLVSYRHRSAERDTWVAFNQNDTSGNELGHNDREQQHEATSVAGVDKRKIKARTKFGAESLDEVETKPYAGERNVKERKSDGKEQSRRGAEVKHIAGGAEGENQTTTLTVCSPPSVPAPMSSTLSVCIPSTLSASMPTNVSAHLSSAVHHPFQCSLCDRCFSQRGSLNRHVRSHLGVRPFPCPRCPMTFSRQYRVMEHMRVHQRCILRSEFQKPPASSM